VTLLPLATFHRREPSIGAISFKLGELIAMIEARLRGKLGATPIHPLRHWRTHALRRSRNLCTAGVSPLGCQFDSRLLATMKVAIREDASVEEERGEREKKEEEGRRADIPAETGLSSPV